MLPESQKGGLISCSAYQRVTSLFCVDLEMQIFEFWILFVFVTPIVQGTSSATSTFLLLYCVVSCVNCDMELLSFQLQRDLRSLLYKRRILTIAGAELLGSERALIFACLDSLVQEFLFRQEAERFLFAIFKLMLEIIIAAYLVSYPGQAPRWAACPEVALVFNKVLLVFLILRNDFQL